MRWGVFKQKLFCLRIIYFFYVLLGCSLFEINISYGFGDLLPYSGFDGAASSAVGRNPSRAYLPYVLNLRTQVTKHPQPRRAGQELFSISSAIVLVSVIILCDCVRSS